MLMLVILHRPDGAAVVVNPRNVTSLHSRLPPPNSGKLLPHGACAVWLSDGRLIAVQESCLVVKALLEGVP